MASGRTVDAPAAPPVAAFTAKHSYAAAGTYNITLKVTDNSGNTETAARAVTVTAPPANVPPTASFTASAQNLAVAFDGSGSSDTDGTISAYAWTFGDGSSGSGATVSHTYAGAGSYTATLKVRDNSGANTSVSRTVTVTAPPADTVLAADAFARTVTGGFGTADVARAWTVAGGNTNFAVNSGSGVATLRSAGASRSAT